MKYLKSLILIPLVFGMLNFSCTKEDDCPPIPECLEEPPTDEDCQVFFTRWFFDPATNTCTEIGYSGCEQYGFATKEECENCEECY